jgi:AraC-like DNA-binding protein
MWTKERILVASPDSHGYHYVALPRLTEDGQPTSTYRNHRVHLLVLLAFVGPIPKWQMGRHLDGDKTNNRLSNLAYGTSQENMYDKYAHGTNPAGSRNPSSKLTEATVLNIRQEFANSRITLTALAQKYQVSIGSVSHIVRGNSWKHVEMPPALLRKIAASPISPAKARCGQHGDMTEEQVLKIRRLFRDRHISIARLARHFNAAYGTIKSIVSGRTWRHLLGQE